MSSMYDYNPFGIAVRNPLADPPPTFFEAVHAAAISNPLTRAVMAAERAGWEGSSDPLWGLKASDYTAITKDLSADDAQWVSDAQSREEMEMRGTQAFARNLAKKQLAEYGWGAGGIDFATKAFDPINLASMMITAGAASAATVAGRAALAARAGIPIAEETALLTALEAGAVTFNRAAVPTAESLVQNAGLSATLNVASRKALTNLGLSPQQAARVAHSMGGTLASGVENAAVNAGMELGLAAADDAESDAQSALYAGLFGFAMGAGFRGAGEIFGGAQKSAQLAMRSILEQGANDHAAALAGDAAWARRSPGENRIGAVGDVGDARSQVTKADQIQLIEDAISTKKFNKEEVPSAWYARLSELRGAGPSEIVGMSVFGHPDATNIMPDKYANLIPIKASSLDAINGRIGRAQKLVDELQSRIVKRKGSKPLTIEEEAVLDLLKTETMPELYRMAKTLEKPLPVAPKAPDSELVTVTTPDKVVDASNVLDSPYFSASKIINDPTSTPEAVSAAWKEVFGTKINDVVPETRSEVVVASLRSQGLISDAPEVAKIVAEEMRKPEPAITRSEAQDLAYVNARATMNDPAATPAQKNAAINEIRNIMADEGAHPRDMPQSDQTEYINKETGEVTPIGKAKLAVAESEANLFKVIEEEKGSEPSQARIDAEQRVVADNLFLKDVVAKETNQPPPDTIYPPMRPKNADDAFADPPVNTAKSVKGRITWFGEFGNSASLKMRQIGAVLIGDSLLRADGSFVSPNDMAGWAHRNIARLWDGSWIEGTRELFNDWRVTNRGNKTGIAKLWDHYKAREAFANEVGLAMMGFSKDPHAIKAASVMADIYEETLTQNKIAGTQGAMNLPYDRKYVQRIFAGAKMSEFLAKNNHALTGPRGLIELIRRGIKDLPEFADKSPKELRAIARGYATTISKLDHMRFMDSNTIDSLNRDIVADVTRAFNDEGVDNPQLLEQTIFRLQQDSGPSAAMFKRKLPLDISASMTNADGTVTRIVDLLETNADTLMMNHIRQASNIAGGSTALRALSLAHKVEYRNWGDVVGAVKKEMSDKRIDTLEGSRGAQDLATLERAARYFEGKPMDEVGSKALNESARTVMAFNNVFAQPAFTLSQIPESITSIGIAGLRNVIEQLPVAADLIRSFATGKVSNTMLKEMRNLGHGLNMGFHNRVLQVDTWGTEAYRETNKFYLALQRTGDVTGFLSLFHPLQQLSEAMYAASKFQDLFDAARTGRELTTNNLLPLRLTAEQWKAIAADMVKHGKATGNRLDDPNFSKWDPENAARFKAALSRDAMTVIQRQELGDRVELLQHWFPRLLTQYKSFAITSYEKQMRNGWQRVSRGDWQYGMMAAFQSLVAGMVYAGNEYSKTIGMSEADARAYREKALSPTRIITAGFARSSWASLLPTVSNYGLYAVGANDQITTHRPSMTVLDLLRNPTVTTIDSAISTVRGASQLVRGKNVTRKNLNSAAYFIPMRRAIGWGSIADSVINKAPKQEEP